MTVHQQPTLFLVDGASGTGKSDLLEYVTSSPWHAGVVVKATTRPKRDYEGRSSAASDLVFCSRAEFDAMAFDYRYEYSGHLYGFHRAALDASIEARAITFVIVRNVPTMSQLRRDYRDYTVVTVYVHSDLQKIEQRLREQQQNQAEIAYRLARIEETFRDYVANSAKFDSVIINIADRRTYYRLIDNLIAKYSGDARSVAVDESGCPKDAAVRLAGAVRPKAVRVL